MRETYKKSPSYATRKLEMLGDIALHIPLFVMCELQAGACLARTPKRELKKIEFFKEYVDVLYPDASFAATYGRLESYLRKAGTSAPTMDLLIAVTAVSNSMPLLTNNAKGFKHIPELVIETYAD